MDFGIFTEQLREGGSQEDWFKEIHEFAEKGEAWGLDVLWLAEMLVNPARSVLSAPLLVATSIAAQTRRLRVGTAVQLLPLNHPLRVAGEITTLDHLSHGRFDFGIGRSGSPRAYDALGVSYAASQERFFEALEVILEAWKGEPFSHAGKYYRFDNAAVSPRPYRPPHPPVRMAATTPETFPRVAKLGLPIFVGLRGMSIPELSGHLETYRAAWRAAGHAGEGDVCLRIPVYAAPTETAAIEEPRETALFYFKRQAELTRAPIGRAGTGPAERLQTQAQQLDALSYDTVLATKVAFGTGPGLVDRFTMLRDELHLTGVAAELNPGGLLTLEQEMRTLQILTQQVMPAFKKAARSDRTAGARVQTHRPRPPRRRRPTLARSLRAPRETPARSPPGRRPAAHRRSGRSWCDGSRHAAGRAPSSPPGRDRASTAARGSGCTPTPAPDRSAPRTPST